ncbi:MAG: hypothetical protein J5892_03025 [Bacilli bacterium]|nr:hypothetical protein [Bacilli bacterium]
MPKSMKKVYQISLIVIAIVIVLVVSSSSKKTYIEAKNETVTNKVDLNMMALRVEEEIKNDIYSAKDTYVGHLTGYTARCPLCTGHLACKSSYDVLNGQEYYNDPTYGNVRIVASSRNLPCGTIVRFNQPRISSEPIIAIVLDRGVLGTALDLLTNSEEYAVTTIGRSTVSYDVLRESWGNKE